MGTLASSASQFSGLEGTHFLSTHDVAQIIARQGLVPCLAGLLDTVRQDYLRWPVFDKCPRAASHSAQGVIELMPIADAQYYAFKYVNGHPQNTRLGLSTVMAFGVLAEVATGLPLLCAELTLCTALRTAATSVLAAQHLARKDSRCMALIGCGAQSEFQALAFQHLLGIERLRIVDCDAHAMRKLQSNLLDLGLEITACPRVADAVQGADIVTTLTADKRRANIIQTDMLQPGMHFNAVGGDCPGKTELDANVLLQARVFVEYEAQTRLEGDIQQMPANFPVTELWRVLNGQAAGRQSAQEITVFDSVGFALEDFSVLRYMREQALRLGIGSRIDLIPALDDPRNLYGMLRAAPLGTPRRLSDVFASLLH